MLIWLEKCLKRILPEPKPDRRRMDALTKRFLRMKLKKAGLRESALCRHFQLKRLDSLRMDRLDEAMNWIKQHS